MGSKKSRENGPQRHAEGQHGSRTHRHFIKQLHEPHSAAGADDGASTGGEGGRRQRLHQDRQQHDEAEKNSEKVEAMREVQRGKVDDNVLGHARIPHESDGR